LKQYNPFETQFSDSLLIQCSNSLINSLFINRNSNLWGLDFIQQINAGKVLLNYGVDTRQQNEYQTRGRFNLNKKMSALLAYKVGQKSFASNFLETRSYLIKYHSWEPALTGLFKNNQWRVQSSYRFEKRENTMLVDGEKSLQHMLISELKYNFLSAGSISSKTTFTRIQYNGQSQTSIGYIMLDGLLPGNNWLWSVQFDRRLSRNVEMSLSYDGRKPAGAPSIHTGRATVRAIF
jgi:hypothetical protein